MLSQLDLSNAARAVSSLDEQKAVAIDCLSRAECEECIELAEALPYRRARPVTGQSTSPVEQDFELNYEIPDTHFFWTLTRFIEQAIGPVMASHRDQRGLPEEPLKLNDLIVQRYPPGCRGITPHRDHLSYRLVVLILLLSGDGEFRVHASRETSEGIVIPFQPGQMLLMGAPGFTQDFHRPFHSVCGVSQTRRTVGLRYDARII